MIEEFFVENLKNSIINNYLNDDIENYDVKLDKLLTLIDNIEIEDDKINNINKNIIETNNLDDKFFNEIKSKVK